jgi:hypothetical protein
VHWLASCELWPKLDCQNSCMRFQHQTKHHAGWAAAKLMCALDPTSEECCIASFVVEQKEYGYCASKCFGSLLAIPFSLRIGMGLQGLESCKVKSKRKPWNRSR